MVNKTYKQKQEKKKRKDRERKQKDKTLLKRLKVVNKQTRSQKKRFTKAF